MLSVHATGTLIGDPKSKDARNGKPFATCAIRVPVEGGEAIVVSVIGFEPDVVAALMQLSKGEACSIAGRGRLAQWESDGNARHGLSLIADKVLTVYAAGKARKASRDDQ